jgi:hypothetical protein
MGALLHEAHKTRPSGRIVTFGPGVVKHAPARRVVAVCERRYMQDQERAEGRDAAGRLRRGAVRRPFEGLPASGLRSIVNHDIDFSS